MQKRTSVDWSVTGVDPAAARFGRKSAKREANSVGAVLQPAEMPGTVFSTTQVVVKPVDDYRNAEGYKLGTTRGAVLTDKSKHPVVYGRPSQRADAGEWGTADCMRGDFTAEEQAPDADLGVSTSRGFRNAGMADPRRRFGIPSIRTDVPARQVSVATSVDFGAGLTAKELLFPQPYAENGVDESDFAAPRSEGELRSLFARIGYEMSAAEFAAFYTRAATVGTLTPAGSVCVQELREVINEVLAARDEGTEPTWFAVAMAAAEASVRGGTHTLQGTQRR